jgi:hypothetical protein
MEYESISNTEPPLTEILFTHCVSRKKAPFKSAIPASLHISTSSTFSGYSTRSPQGIRSFGSDTSHFSFLISNYINIKYLRIIPIPSNCDHPLPLSSEIILLAMLQYACTPPMHYCTPGFPHIVFRLSAQHNCTAPSTKYTLPHPR